MRTATDTVTGMSNRRPVSAWPFLCLAVVTAVAGVALMTGMVASRAGVAAGAAPVVGESMPVTPVNQLMAPANNSPAVVADPTDDRFVIIANRLDAPDFGCALQVSGDGGRSWLSADVVPTLPAGAEKCYGAEAAFDANGRLYFLFVGLAGQGNQPMGAFLTSSDDRARTFSTPRQVLGPLNFGVRLAVDRGQGSRGRIHLVWLHAASPVSLGSFGSPPNPIRAAHSDDGGATFSEPVQVSDPARQRVVAPALALGPGHRVHVGYYDLGRDARDYHGLEGPVWEENWSLIVATSHDGGRSFGPSHVVDDGIVPSERVMLIFTMPPAALAAGPGARVCTAWTDGRHGDPDVLLRCSRDRGVTWEEVRRVNDDPIGNGASQYLPQLARAPDGRLDAIFFDRRGDPRNTMVEVSYTFSADGGRRFSPNRPVTSEPMDSRIGQQYAGPAAEGLVEIGARLGLLARADGALAAWPDTRHAKPRTPQQDLYATHIQLPTSGGPGRTVGAGLLAVAVVASVGAAWAARRRSSRRP